MSAATVAIVHLSRSGHGGAGLPNTGLINPGQVCDAPDRHLWGSAY